MTQGEHLIHLVDVRSSKTSLQTLNVHNGVDISPLPHVAIGWKPARLLSGGLSCQADVNVHRTAREFYDRQQLAVLKPHLDVDQRLRTSH